MPSTPNPYAPFTGSPPPFLAGRDAWLSFGQRWSASLGQGQPSLGLLLQGLHGSGKTVLLRALAGQTRPAGAALYLQAQPGRPLALLLIPALRACLHQGPPSPATTQALTLLAGFRLAHAPRLPANAADPAALPGHGDSGDLEADLAAVLEALGQAWRDRGAGLLLLLDDAHSLERAELSSLLRAHGALGQRGLPLGLGLAGLPLRGSLGASDQGLVDRLFQAAELEPLSEADASLAVQAPARSLGKAWEPEALRELGREAKGHPALLQAWAYHAWERARGGRLSAAAVRQAEPAARQALDQRFYGPGFDRLSPREKGYLRSMAHLGPGPHRSSDIADSMDAKVTALGPLRAKLIKEGWVYCPAHGSLGFTAPGMDGFMRRAMPNFR